MRDLHDRLSEHLERVERGADIVVTRRGKPIAKLSGVAEDPLGDLVRRGVVELPRTARRAQRATVESSAPVSELVAEQRR